MPLSLFLHFIALGVWLGCVLVEAVLEVEAKKRPQLMPVVAELCLSIDTYVEIPTFCAVLGTGLWMFKSEKLSLLYCLKLGCGLAAVLVNVLCVIPVFRRKQAATRGDAVEIERRTKQIYLANYVGGPFALIALAIGLYFLGIFSS